MKISGVITALATPFAGGQVDAPSFSRLVRQQIEQGIDGFVINGTTGESPTLQRRETRKLFDIAKAETGGKIPLIVGAGSNSTETTCELVKEAGAWKPDAVLVVVPYYNRPPQRGLIAHFTAVADVSPAPVILYNVPSRTVAALDAATIIALSKHANILGIKEATGDMDLLEELRQSARRDFALLSGDDVTCVDFCARGGHGVISVSSHIIGREMKDLIRDKAVADYAKKYSDLMLHLYVEPNPIPLKAALHWMGLFTSMELRSPLVALNPTFHKDFKACLAALGKI